MLFIEIPSSRFVRSEIFSGRFIPSFERKILSRDSTGPKDTSRPFHGGGGDLNNFEIFPQARRGNPLTCKTTLPLGLPRRLLLPRHRSDFFPPTDYTPRPSSHFDEGTQSTERPMSPRFHRAKLACKIHPPPSWKRRARALTTILRHNRFRFNRDCFGY